MLDKSWSRQRNRQSSAGSSDECCAIVIPRWRACVSDSAYIVIRVSCSLLSSAVAVAQTVFRESAAGRPLRHAPSCVCVGGERAPAQPGEQCKRSAVRRPSRRLATARPASPPRLGGARRPNVASEAAKVSGFIPRQADFGWSLANKGALASRKKSWGGECVN